MKFATDLLLSLPQGIGNCAISKWEPDLLKKEMAVKNVIDAEIIKGKIS